MAQRAKKSKSVKPSPSKPPANHFVKSSSFTVVGVGASAGGLEAFAALLGALPANPGAAFVLIQHLDPKHESMLTEILSRATTMPVMEAKDGTKIKVDHVYIIPPNANLAIEHKTLRVRPRTFTRGLHMPVDIFLRALAEDQKNRAIGVILSGTASDGVLGMKAIKAEGGITFAQDEKSAKHPGMPHSAVAAGVVDFILSPEEIASEIQRFLHHPYVTSLKAVLPGDTLPESRSNLTKIYDMLRNAFRTDFSGYKDTTIRRRIKRRMVLHKMDEPEVYVRYLQDHPDEVEALYHDILINVTSFLRDPGTFEALKSKVFPKITEKRKADAPIRVWVPGCATGEEAYSIAISLLEYLKDVGMVAPIQIFGTDVSQVAIERARMGTYLENIALDVSPDRLHRFFLKLGGGGYQVSRLVRDLCIFAQHDLTKDPPFSKVDLITCRNLLIYLQASLQGKVLRSFHYALLPHGYLMLGSSETIGSYGQIFHLIDKKNKIYVKKETALRRPLDFPPLHSSMADRTSSVDAKLTGPVKREFDVVKEADRIVQANFAPAGVVISEAMEILQFRGRTSDFLEPAPGAASFNIMKMAREGLLPDLRMAVHEARKQDRPVTREDLQIRVNGQSKSFNLSVHPIGGQRGERYFLVLFDARPLPEMEARGRRRAASKVSKDVARDQQHRIEELRREVSATKEYLESSIDEQEATNQELKSANEEIMSSNEELQSSNEELETAREELQSSNEELTTLNEELLNRNLELTLANNDFQNLLNSIHIPVVMLDRDLRIRRATPQAEKLMNLIPSDIGRPLGDIRLNLDRLDLEEIIASAIDTVTAKELEVKDRSGRWYWLTIRPYKTQDNRIEGAIMILLDIDALKQTTEELRRFKFISDNASDASDLIDEEGRLLYVNRRAWERLGYTEEEMLQMRLEDIDPLLSKEKVDALFERLEKERIPPFESLRRRKDGSTFPVEISVTKVDLAGQRRIFLVARNITERKRVEEELRRAYDKLEERVAQRTAELNEALRNLQTEMMEKQRAQEDLMESEHRYRELFENASDILYTLDMEGNITSINRAGEQVLGYTQDEAVKLNVERILAPETIKAERDAREDGGNPRETSIRAKDGRWVPLEVTSRLIYNRDTPVEVHCIARDVSERRRLEEERKELSLRLMRAQDEERRSLARELHDTTGQNLVALKLNLSSLDDKAAKLDPKVQHVLKESENLADQCIREIRTMSYLLHPPLLEERGLASALRLYVEGFSERSGISVDMNIPEDFGRLPHEIELVSFLVVQECLTNVHRHSGGSKAAIQIQRGGNRVTLAVRAEGSGFKQSTPEGVRKAEERGIGIRGMRERLRQLGGTLEIESSKSGSVVRATLPAKTDGRTDGRTDGF